MYPGGCGGYPAEVTSRREIAPWWRRASRTRPSSRTRSPRRRERNAPSILRHCPWECHGLWDVIAPCGRRTSVDALARKRLAVDASIWLIQFVKAMRDDSGEMLRNAPLLGLFRRLCKLLFLHVQPVLVFDGVTPEIKRRTVSRRRAFRERQEASLQRTAEKILLNQLKGRHLLQGVAGGPQPSRAAPAAAPAAAPQADDGDGDDAERAAALADQFGDDDALHAPAAGDDAGGFIRDDGSDGGGGGGFLRDDGGDADDAGGGWIREEADEEGGWMADDAGAAADGGEAAAPSRAHFEDLADDKVANASAASGSMIDVNRATLGSVVVPRAGELDEEAVRALPPAMQFEVLEEIKLGERNRRRDALVRREHTADSFSHQQLHNYIQVAKVAGRVNELREQLNNTAQQSRRIASDQTREYVLLDRRAGATPSPAAAAASDAPWDGDSDEGEGEGEAAAAAAVAGQGDEETELARAVALSLEDAAATRRREGKRRVPAASAAAAAAPPRAAAAADSDDEGVGARGGRADDPLHAALAASRAEAAAARARGAVRSGGGASSSGGSAAAASSSGAVASGSAAAPVDLSAERDGGGESGGIDVSFTLDGGDDDDDVDDDLFSDDLFDERRRAAASPPAAAPPAARAARAARAAAGGRPRRARRVVADGREEANVVDDEVEELRGCER